MQIQRHIPISRIHNYYYGAHFNNIHLLITLFSQIHDLSILEVYYFYKQMHIN